MLFLSSSLLGACCGMNIKAEINFINVDSELDYKSYVEVLDIGQGLEMVLDIPEGFDHEGLVVTLNGTKDIPYEVIYDNPNVEEKYRYTTGKTIKFSVAKATTDFTVDVDMTKVTRRAFTLNISSGITSSTTTLNDKKENVSNLYAVSINPDGLDRLTRLDASNVLAKRLVVNNKVTVYYDEYIALCYEKPSGYSEFSAFYTDVNYFTSDRDILHLGTIDYCQYSVSKSGNNYYHLYGSGLRESDTRLFYIGRIQEGFNVYEKIPNYVSPQGFELDDDENKFSILTSSQEYNSEMLTIRVFAPTDNEVTEDEFKDTVYDKMGGQIAKEISPTERVNYRYDRFDMYIGDNISEDKYIENSEKSTLPSKLYLVVESNIGETSGDIASRLYFCLLHYEKMSNTVPHVVFNSVKVSDKNKVYFEITQEVVETYIDNQFDVIDGTSYKTGNAIFYVTINDNWKSECYSNSTFPYTAINYRIFYDGVFKGIDNNYKYSLYILNEDGTKDYGLLDIQTYSDETVYFPTDKLFELVEENGGSKEKYRDNLYFDIIGKKYNTIYCEIIHGLTAKSEQYTGSSLDKGRYEVKDAKEFNGILGAKVEVPYRWAQDQCTFNFYLDVSDVNESNYQINCSQIEFGVDDGTGSSGTILMTNNINFESSDDFVRVTSWNKDDINTTGYNDSISFGVSTEIYYFVTNPSLQFDIYMGSDSDLKISTSTPLKDIVGNDVYISYNNKRYQVYVKYQSVEVYSDSNVTMEYYAK